jgi:hypothetical protein
VSLRNRARLLLVDGDARSVTPVVTEQDDPR